MACYDEDLDVICNLYHSDFDNEHIRTQLQLLGANFDVVTAGGAMNIFHVKGYAYGLLSVTQPGAAIANVASGHTSPVHSGHCCNEC